MRRTIITILAIACLSFFGIGIMGCPMDDIGSAPKPTTTAGVKKYDIQNVTVDEKGRTTEQANIETKIDEENDPDGIWHLYVISCYSGQVLEHVTVKGKITSSGKRLTPYTVAAMDGQYVDSDLNGMRVKIGDRWYRTAEVIQEDGTYGHSDPSYLFFRDIKGNMQRIYPEGGIYIRVTKYPIGGVKPVILNVEVTTAN